MSAKELYIAKYYISVKKWVPAINRLKIIVDEYSKTIFIEEALHRLVEIHYHLGLEEEAKNMLAFLVIITILVNGLNNHIKYSIKIINLSKQNNQSKKKYI